MCKCEKVEEFLRSDTQDEYSGVAMVCILCGRNISVDELSRDERREVVKKQGRT
jgi:hypothetical protein